VLDPGGTRTFSFRVLVGGGTEIVNEQYGARAAGGISVVGTPVTTRIRGGAMFLPLVPRY
jgi:hypothetical protein